MKKEDESEDNVHAKVMLVDAAQEPIRLDIYLLNKLKNYSRSKIQKMIKSNQILVNTKDVKSNFILKPYDQIHLSIPDSIKNEHITPENIPLDVIFEDDHLLIINKPAGLVVHPGHGNHSGTLVNAIAHYLGSDLPTMEGNEKDRIGLVHRIDKDTSGLLVLAKTDEAMNGLAKQFFNHSIERKYLALVWGQPDHMEGKIEGNIGRNPVNRLQQTVFPDGDQGKYALTHFKVLKPMYYVSLLECWLETGRTHQIRVHMKYAGHTLFNDARYGGEKILKGTVFSKYKQFVNNCFKILPRQALHAKSLGFIHPISNERMYFESDLPNDFQQLIDKWEDYLTGRKEIMKNG